MLADPGRLPGLHPLLARVYAARGIADPAELERGAAGLLPPGELLGMAQAVAILVRALEQQQKVLVIGDFDADGATSSALSVLALRAMGLADVDYLVPNRFEFGYGLTPEIVEVARQQAPAVLITVDNGISSHEGVRLARQHGIEVIITDHHLAGAELPAASAIVNPNQPGCGFPSKSLAGVGVAFYLMSALRAELRRLGWFDRRGLAEPNMAELLDLVALGTVADVVPLDRNNRILVHQGLQRIRRGLARPGILALLAVAGRAPRNLVAADLAFAVAPRLNAAGRIDDMSLGIHCLLTNDPGTAAEMAGVLDEFNRERRDIEQGMQQEANLALERLHMDRGELPWGICLFDEAWHQGVVGILAARVKDRYHRPVIAFARADNGEIKGSARSVPALHIRDALEAVATRHPELLRRFGGHAMAAGLSIDAKDFQAFAHAFDAEVRRVLLEEDLQQVMLTDGDVPPEWLDLATAELLREGGPWGQHFPAPVFEGSFRLLDQRLVGQHHLKLMVSPEQRPDLLLDAIAFRIDTAAWPNPAAERARLVYQLDVNEFRGRRSLQLVVEHLSVT